jgi:N4-gp56 family major capsid protein
MSTYSTVGSPAGGVALTDAIRTVYSSLIMFAAQPIERFAQFAEIREELGIVPGKTIQFMKYAGLSAAENLTELTDMSVEALSSSTVSITVTEKGKAVGVSEYLLQTAFTDVMADSAALLGHNFGSKEDTDLRDIVIACTNVKYAWSTTAAASRAEITSSHIFGTEVIKDAVELLNTNNAPKVGGEFWVCFVHPHQARDLRDDAAWISANEYAGSRNIFLGEVGMYEDVIFIETTQMPILTGSGSGSDDVYQGVIFGDMAYGYAVSLPVELRDNGTQDFGRKHALAWYSIYGAAILQDDFIVRLESS